VRRHGVGLRLLVHAAGAAALGLLLFPVAAVFLGAFQLERDLATDVLNPVPEALTLDNFRLLVSGGDRGEGIGAYVPPNIDHLPRAFLNSTFVATTVTVLVVGFGALSAYSIARLRVSWTRGFLYMSLATRLVPIMTLMVPLYVTLRSYGLLNTLTGIIVTEVGFLLPYAIWILTGFFAALPRELEESARVDGCSRLQAFWYVLVPVATPGLASCAVIMFILSWNELIIPLVISTRPEAMTMPVILAGLVGDRFVFFTLMMALCLIALIPSVLLAVLLRRYVVQGLTAGALKG
jgi:ABC-type glycerol-3-phosphate transport system permease component